MKFVILFLVYLVVLVKDQRIAGGTDVSISDYPFAVSLLTNGGVANAEFVHRCGGTIITANAILSAASCFVGPTGTAQDVSWFRTRVGSSSSQGGGTIYFINRITLRPDFVLNTRVNDIAVVRTTLSITLGAGSAEAARIAGAAYSFEANQPLVAIGWGAPSRQTDEPTEYLRRVQIWAIDQQTCTNRYSALNFAVTNNMVCVGWHDVGIRGQCPGDAGSPLLDANNAVVGVFTWAEGCADSWFPDINTRVAPYTSWIVTTALA